MFPTKFQVNWPFGSGGEVEKKKQKKKTIFKMAPMAAILDFQ